MENQLLDVELEKAVMFLSKLNNKQWDYIVRNVNYKKYINYEKRKRDYELALFLKELNNWSINIYTQILSDNKIDRDYLENKLEYFIKCI
ncbi:MAG: hypothetical protein OSJ63_05560 [Bacilli bacterium]|nr:hypothetical protein [Bacilli bacterium]